MELSQTARDAKCPHFFPKNLFSIDARLKLQRIVTGITILIVHVDRELISSSSSEAFRQNTLLLESKIDDAACFVSAHVALYVL